MSDLAKTWNYPLLNVFWTMLWLFLWILWLFLLIRIIGDVFRSHDLSGWGKAGWTAALILFPFLTALIYLIVRGDSMHTRAVEAMAAADQATREYIRSAAGPSYASSVSTADELEHLAGLRDRGVLNDHEFQAQKAKLLTPA
jgi:Phospholipase_D-nuclease N-terminal/Short C-terminal domain